MNWPHENAEEVVTPLGMKATNRVDSVAAPRKGAMRAVSLDKDFYTSGQAARLLGIPSRTLRRYLSIGKIEGRQNPITQTWQITSESLVKFIESQGGEAVVELKEIYVLVIDEKKAVADLFRKIAETARRPVHISEFQEVGDALIECGVHHHELIVIDTAAPYYDGLGLLRLLRSNPHTRGAKILAITDDPEKNRSLEILGASTTLVKPFTYTNLMQTVEYMFPNTTELPS